MSRAAARPGLRNVPEHAGGHHERMDGAIRAASPATRCRCRRASWALLDIFEVLTASDRPCKPGRARQAVSICTAQAQRHIDPDLFDVFVREKVYLRYAQQFPRSWQIDEVNTSPAASSRKEGVEQGRQVQGTPARSARGSRNSLNRDGKNCVDGGRAVGSSTPAARRSAGAG